MKHLFSKPVGYTPWIEYLEKKDLPGSSALSLGLAGQTLLPYEFEQSTLEEAPIQKASGVMDSILLEDLFLGIRAPLPPEVTASPAKASLIPVLSARYLESIFNLQTSLFDHISNLATGITFYRSSTGFRLQSIATHAYAERSVMGQHTTRLPGGQNTQPDVLQFLAAVSSVQGVDAGSGASKPNPLQLEQQPQIAGCPLSSIQAWHPSLIELPRALYNHSTLNPDAYGIYRWQNAFPLSPTITNVQVAPPVHSIPYVINQDYSGNYTTAPCNEVNLAFPSPGIYVVKVTFEGGSTYMNFLHAGAVAHDGSAPGGQKVQSGPVEIPIPTEAHPNTCVTVHSDLPTDVTVYARVGLVATMSVQTVAQAIAYFDAQACTQVILSGHGGPSRYHFGVGNDTVLQDNSTRVQEFTAALRPGGLWSVYFNSCHAASGMDIFGSNHLMRAVARGLFNPITLQATRTMGWDVCTSTVAASGSRPAHFTAEDGGTLVTYLYTG